MRHLFALLFPCVLAIAQSPAAPAAPGFTPLWNGKDLAGWHGQRHFDPYKLAAMAPEERSKLRAEDDATVAHAGVCRTASS